MAILELSEKLIKDTKYYMASSNYAQTLKKYGIKTVDQILDKKTMYPIIGKICNLENKTELVGLIKLLEHEYLEIPLENNDMLERTILDFTFVDNNMVFHLENKENNNKDTFTSDELFKDIIIGISNPGLMIESVVRQDKEIQAKIRMTKPTVVDLLKMVIQSNIFTNQLRCRQVKVIESIIKTNIESYENKNINNNKECITIGNKSIDILRKQLTRLIKMSEKLDAEIKTVKDQIKELEEKENKGSVR